MKLTLCTLLVLPLLLVNSPILGQQLLDPYGLPRVVGPGPIPVDVVAPDSTDMTLHGRWPYGTIRIPIVSGDYAYMVNGSALQVLDITDPSNISEVGLLDLRSGSPSDLQLEGNILYAVSFGQEAPLNLIDVSDPTAPFVTGTIYRPGNASSKCMAVSGNYAYLGHSEGLSVINIFDPSSPSIVGEYSYASGINRVAVSGQYVYAVTDEDVVQVIDVSDHTTPVQLGTTSAPNYNWGIQVSNNHVYVDSYYDGLWVINISNPAAISLAGTLALDGYTRAMDLSGSYVYLVNSQQGMVTVDVSDPTSPTPVDTCLAQRNILDISVSSSYAYVTEPYNQGLLVFDISTPADPVQAGTYTSPISANNVFVSGDYAYVGAYHGLWVFDVSDSTNPVLTGRFNPHPAEQFGVGGIYVSGDLAYMCAGSKFYVVDVSDPTAPAAAGSLAVYGGAVDVSGSYAYVAAGNEGLRVIDISTPSAPEQVGSYDTPGSAMDVHYVAPYAYVADSGAGVRIIDVTDPTTPVETGSFNTPGYALAVYYSDSHVYVADREMGMPVIDVSDPTTPVEVSTYTHPYHYPLHDMFVSNGTAYLASTYGGLRVLDISDLSEIVDIGVYKMPGADCYTVQVVDGLIYSANHSGFSIMEYSNMAPDSPTIVDIQMNELQVVLKWSKATYLDFAYYKIYRSETGTFTAADSIYALTVAAAVEWWDSEVTSGTVYYYAVSTVDDSGKESELSEAVHILVPTSIEDIAALPGKFSLSQNYPNPFNPETSIAYALPDAAMVELTIYDIRGRQVRRLVTGRVEAGFHQVRWDGKDERGRVASSGVYFYRITAAGIAEPDKQFTSIKKMVIIK